MSLGLAEIFWGGFANAFRRRAQLRKAGHLGRVRAEQRATPRFETLEQRLLLSADLNPVIDDFLATLDTGTSYSELQYDYVADDGVVTIGNSVGSGIADVALEGVTLTFTDLAYDLADASWGGWVGVEALSATLFPGLLDVAVSDRDDDADAFAAAGVIDLRPGTPATLQLDDIDAESIGWPKFIDVEFTELELNFSDFRTNNDLNELHLAVELAGLDTGNDTLNELLAADNPLFGLSIEGFAEVTLAISDIEDTVEAAASLDVVGAMQSALAAATASSLDGLGGRINGKLFQVGELTAGFIYQKVTVDPDGAGPLGEETATYLAVEGGLSINGAAGFNAAFAVSDLGPLQFFVAGGPIKRFEPTTGLTIDEARLGVRFNTTIEGLQTETDFEATAAMIEDVATGARVTLTVPDNDLAIGNDFRIRNAGNGNYDGDYEVLGVNGDLVVFDVAANPGPFVGDAEVMRLTITDPFDLRDEGLAAGVSPPDSIFVWRDQLNAAVASQIEAGDDIWARLFGEVVFGGGATLSIDPIPGEVMQFKVDLLIDTDLRILLSGGLSFLDGLVEFPTHMYADLSDLLSGSGRFLFLADLPAVPVLEPILVYRGEAYFEALAATDIFDALVTQDGAFWDVELELAIDNPSDEFIVGDNAVIYESEVSAFDGTYEVIAVDDASNSITLRSGTDPGAWAAGGAGKVANQNALNGGVRLGVEGGVDVNIPFVTTLTLEGAFEVDFRIPAAAAAEELRMDFAVDAALSETSVGAIGAASGRMHASLDVDVLPTLDNPFGGLEIWGAALLTTNFGFLEGVGLFASASGLLRINSSTTDKPDEVLQDAHGSPVVIELPAQSFALRLDGSVDFRIDFNGNDVYTLDESAFLIQGAFILEFSAEQGFNVAVFREGAGGALAPATLQLGPTGARLLDFEVLGFLAVRADGFAANLALSADASLPLGLASIEATAVLVVNTTGDEVVFRIPGGAVDPDRSGLEVSIPKAAPTDPSAVLASLTLEDLLEGTPWAVNPAAPGAPYGVVFLRGGMELLSVLDLDVSGFILLSPSVVSLEVNFSAAGNFLNLASASVGGTLFFSSEGEFFVDVNGNVQLGPDWINIRGSAELEISFLDDNGRASGGDLDMELDVDGSLSVGATLFGADIGDLTLGVAYTSRTGAITVSVPYPEPYFARSCWDTWFGEVCVYYPAVRTAHYGMSVGSLVADPVPPPPPVLGQVDGSGVLTLNVGSAAGARNLLVDEINEVVLIDRVGGEIQVTMFGYTQGFSGVSSIFVADMGSGDDFLDVRPNVFQPLQVRFGGGDDRLRYAGSGAVIAYGDDGNDRLEGGSAGDHLYGGDGDDFIDGGSGGDWIEGGDDGDTLFGGDGEDSIFGGRGNDLMAGDQGVVEGSATSAVVRTIGSAGSGADNLQGGDGVDILFGGGGGDTLAGNAGDDLVYGEDGVVTIQVNDPDAPPAISLRDLGFGGGDLVVWSVGDGDDVVNGQAGSDALFILGADGGADQVSLGASGAGFTAVLGTETLEVAGVEGADVEGQRGADSFTIHDLAGSGLQHLNLGLGTDSVQDSVVVHGSGNADVFSVRTVGDVLRVQKAGGATVDISGATPASGGDTLALNAGGGDDEISVLATAAGTFTSVNGEAGADTIRVGSLAPALGGMLDGVAAPLSVDGGDDDDTLSVDDSGDTASNSGLLTGTTLTGLGMVGGIVYSRLEEVRVGLGEGDDAFTIESTHEGTTLLDTGAGDDTVNVRSISGDTTVDAGIDDDTLNVGSAAPGGGMLEGIGALLTLEGNEPSSGSDVLNVDDSGDTVGNTGTLTSALLTGLGMGGGIAYGTIETLHIALGSGGDDFTIESTHAGQTTLDTNAGDDTVNVRAISGATTIDTGLDDDTVNVGSLAPAAGGTLEGIGALLTIEGSEPSSGSDVLNVDDAGDTVANTGTLTSTMLTGLGMGGGIAYGTVETLHIALGSGGDTFTIESTHSGATTLEANGGDDTVNVQAISGATTVDTGIGDDTVNVGSLAPAPGGTLDGIGAPLDIDGGEGGDVLQVDDTGNADPASGVLTATTLSGLGMAAGIGYSGLETLEVSLGDGGNQFLILGTMRRDDADVSTVVNTGNGDDVVTISVTEGVDGPLTVNLQGGHDTLDASGSTLSLVIAGGEGDDDLSGGEGDDTLYGDVAGDPSLGGADVIHGNGGNDKVWGGGGDDVLFGGLGDDELHGEDGNDILLGDSGEVEGGSVLLVDVATLAGEWPLSGADSPGADPAVLAALLETDVLLLAGRTLADGTQDMRVMLLALAADGDDVLSGGEGNDALFGQRGDDALSGDAGDDLLSGGAGNDALRGGEGNDTLVGDDVHIDSAAAAFPNVAHGLMLEGATLVPMVSAEPGRNADALLSSLPHVLGDDDPALLALAAVVPGFAGHLDQLNGNDELWGDAGDDTLVGDDQRVFARTVEFDADRMARAEGITRALLDVSDDLSDLVHRQYGLLDGGRHGHHFRDDVTVVDDTLTVGADRLDGGEGNDVLVGDDSLVVEAAFTLPVGLAADFERFAKGMVLVAHELTHVVQDLGDLDRHLREETVLVPHKRHVHETLVRHVDLVETGNDVLQGGEGNDLIVGDDFSSLRAEVTLVPGGSPRHSGGVSDWLDRDWRDGKGLGDGGSPHGYPHHHHHHDTHHRHDHHGSGPAAGKTGADVISGGAGDDLVWGDDVMLTSSTVVRGAGLGWHDYVKARHEARDGLEAILAHAGRSSLGHEGGSRADRGDFIEGGEGDDLLFGQAGDDHIHGDAGNDWVIGGDGRDRLEGGPGKDRVRGGEDSSRAMEREVSARLIDWGAAFAGYGLQASPFETLSRPGGCHPDFADFVFRAHDRPGRR